MVKYAPRKVYIRESGGYVELSYTEFCRCRESDQTYMDKLFIPIQGCLLEVVREQYTDFYRDKERWRYLQKLDTKNRLLNKSKFFVLSPLSNSNGLPIISPKIAPYIYASNSRITPAPLFLCYNMSIIKRHLHMVAVWATLSENKNAGTILHRH